MSLTGQGLASGFTGGFKMMDDYYNRQKTQKLNQQAADNAQKTFDNQEIVFEQSQKKRRVEDAIQNITAEINNGQLPSQSNLDILQNDAGFDLYGSFDPKMKQAQQDILNQKFNIQSPEFTTAANLVFGSKINQNNSQVPFESTGKRQYNERQNAVYSPTPEKIKGNKILHKKLINGAYALEGGVVGGDLEIIYEDANGNTQTYIAPMTRGAGTAGDGDNIVGQDVDGLLANVKGTMLLSDGLEPLMKRIRQLKQDRGIETPMSSVDTNMITTYTSLGTKHMSMAQGAVAQFYPKSSSSEANAIKEMFNKKEAPKTVISGGVSQPVNIQAWNAYKDNMAKAQKYFSYVDNIYIKYNGYDYQSLSSVEGSQPQATGGSVTDAVNQIVANQTKDAATATSVAPATTDATTTDTNVAANIPVRPAGNISLADKVAQQAQQFKHAPNFGDETPLINEPKGLSTPIKMFEAFSTNPQSAAVAADPNSLLKVLPTNRASNMDAIDMVTDNANAIVTMSQNGTLAEWLASDPENQRVADNTAMHLDRARETTGAYEDGAGDRLRTLVSNNGLALDDLRHYKFQENLANQQAQQATKAIDYTKESVIDAEIVDMKAALDDPNMMAMVRKEISNDPSAHIKDVEALLYRIQQLPKNNKTYAQYESVYKYWTEIGGLRSMGNPTDPLGDGFFDRWTQGVMNMGLKTQPSVYDEMESGLLMNEISKAIAMAETGTLIPWINKSQGGSDEVIKQIYAAAVSRKAPAAVLERFESALKNMPQQ